MLYSRRPLRESLQRAHTILPKVQFLVRLDSGNDSADNVDVCRKEGPGFLIKRNLRKERPEGWLERARSEGTAEVVRPGRAIYRGACDLPPGLAMIPSG